MNRFDFFYPRASYQGHIQPENLVFNANLQEFSQRISYICGLEQNGKLPPQVAYQQIADLWQQLERSAVQLGIRSRGDADAA